MLSLDIVMQGPIWSKTYITAESYLTLPWVNKVFISTWEDQDCWDTNYRIKVIKSKKLLNPGCGNRNNQIYSSLVGIQHCSADLVMKTRTDQQILIPSMKKMHDYFINHYFIDKKFLDGTGPKGTIFTIGLYTLYAFHPQDHLFYGFREDVLKLFNIPLTIEVPEDLNNPKEKDGNCFTHDMLRANAYIGANYYAHFDSRIKYMLEHYKEFIVDLAPNRLEALAKDCEYRDIIFKAFPPIELWWEKHSCTYPYAEGKYYSEYCAEESNLI
jgi:hypothetical protein